MQNNSFTTTIEVIKSAEDVYADITDNVSKWWGGQDFQGNSSKLNDEFVIHHPGAHYSKQKLVEAIPNKKMVWFITESQLYWLKKDTKEWENTKMIFEITAKEGLTTLHFTHEGLVPEKECYDMCTKGWHTVIKDYLYNFIVLGEAHF